MMRDAMAMIGRKGLKISLSCVLVFAVLMSEWGMLAWPSQAEAAVPSMVVTLDTADSLSGWSSSNPLTLDSADKQEGTASLSMTGSQVVQFQKAFASPVDSQMSLRDGALKFWYYVDDVSLLDGTYGQVELTSSGGSDVDELYWEFTAKVLSQLSDGWNLVSLALDDVTGTLGDPDLAAIDYFRIYFFNTQSPVVKLDHVYFEQKAEGLSSPIITLDTADSLSSWSSGNPLTLDSANKREGTASLSMTGSQTMQFEKAFATPVDSGLTMRYGTLNFWYYVDDVSKLVGTHGQVEISSSGSYDVDEISWDFALRVLPQLNDGWNFVTLKLDGTSDVLGNPDLGAIDFFRIYLFNAQSPTIKLDHVYFEQRPASSVDVTLDTADSLSGWSSANPLTLDTANKREGTASLSMAGSQAVQFQKTFSAPVDSGLRMQYGTLNFWYYVDDVSKLEGTYGQVELSSSGGPDVDEISWDFASLVLPQLSNGWNLVTLKLDSTSVVLGHPDFEKLDFFRIFFLNAQSPVVKLDYIFLEQFNPNAVVLDRADALTGWSSANTLTLDTTDKAEGRASLSRSGSGTVEFEKTFGAPFDALVAPDAGMLLFYYYIEDISKLSGATGTVGVSSSGSLSADAYTWEMADVLSQAADGWHLVALKLDEADVIGSPDLSAIDYFLLELNKSSSVLSKLDTIYFVEQEGLPQEHYAGTGTDMLTLEVTNAEGSGNKYVYQKVAMPDYKFQPGDYIEYDLRLDGPVNGAGGLDILVLEGGNFRDTGWVDQNGLSGHGGSANLSSYADNQWYHRKLKVPLSMIRKHIDQLLLVGENDKGGLGYSTDYKNIVVTDRLGNLRYSFFAEVADKSLVGEAYSSGVTASAVTGGQPVHAPQAQVRNTTFAAQDVVIAGFDVTDVRYGADPTGVLDATAAFRHALNDCAIAGGGVVYAPDGQYKLLGSLLVPNSCTLRGDWKQPTDNDKTVDGTLLLAYPGHGDEQARPFITMGTSAGIRNLSIFYPEQKIGEIVPYPYTIDLTTPSSGTAMNLTLVNAYRGLLTDKRVNGLHYIRDVYGTPLQTGMYLDYVYDVGRVEEVGFSPDYWAESGLDGSPSATAISAYTQGDNGSVGIVIARNDWEVLNGVTIDRYATGIRFIGTSGSSNGSIYNLTIKDARVGVDAEAVSLMGWLISASSIEATAGPEPVAVLASSGFEKTSLQFNKTAFSGSGSAVRLLGDGLLSFVNSSFDSWDTAGCVIEAEAGSLLVQGSEFAAATGGARHMCLGSGVSSASLLSNDYNGSAAIDNANPANSQIVIDQSPRTYEEIDGAPYVRSVHPKPAETGTGDMFDVSASPYHAAADGVTDDTAAIQDALDEAGANGGGTVYLPAGKYRVDGHLEVPAGVELRGAQDVPFHTMSHGTVLYAYVAGDAGNAAGTPFIKLNSDGVLGGSGIRGILIWYPEQDIDSVKAYPWAIQSQGPDCWIIYTNVSNAYQGVDFGTYNNNGHVIDYLSGAGLKTGLFAGNTTTEGWVENVHFNPTYWTGDEKLLNSPTGAETLTKIWPWQKANGTSFVFGAVANGYVSETFVFGANDGMRFIEQPGLGSFHGTVLNHGTDGSKNGVRFSSLDTHGVSFINLETVQYDNGHFVVVDDTVSGSAPIRLFNTNHWTNPTVGYDIRGGDVLLQQGHFVDGGVHAIKVAGGTLDVQTSYFATGMATIVDNAGGAVSVTGSAAAGGVTVSGTVAQDGNVSR
ncbi:glycosyl hydrolase family 28-related protein [Paenibacillus paridis]|uniref:glycosyl hydrolase family 28-related protein n=1 Tax=Paenibacillus paridis TaxID=2583376 RepID=UPI00111F9B3E|nr:glycosyl hydrolase family 28-related protein [Paenibacillus paridis]